MTRRLEDINQRLEELANSPQTASGSQEFISLFQEKRKIEQSTSAGSNQSSQNGLPSSEQPVTGAAAHSGSILANVSRELSRLEKRDWELWFIVALAGILVGAGLLAFLLPAAFMAGESFHLEITVPRQLVVGLIVLLMLLNTYLVTRRIELRRLRERIISSTIQNELIRLQSFTDPLTEIYNRRSLDELANRYVSHARRSKKPLTFMLIDVDRFKEVNTRFGHLTGDFVLAEIAALLRTSVRGNDAVIRYGGDEFLTILADASINDAEKISNRMQSYLNDWNRSSQLENFSISLSIGVAEWVDGKTLDEVLDLADQDMYTEKGKASTSSASKASAASSRD